VLGEEPHAFVPLSFKAAMTPGWDGRDNYADYYLYLFARLQTGVSMQQAEAALNTVYSGIVEDHAKTIRDRDAAYIERYQKSRLKLIAGHQGQSTMRTESKVPIFTLMAATGLVLLIAMANAANLLLAGRRSAGRNWRSAHRWEQRRAS
jgi:putative ABC transport system permease protein